MRWLTGNRSSYPESKTSCQQTNHRDPADDRPAAFTLIAWEAEKHRHSPMAQPSAHN